MSEKKLRVQLKPLLEKLDVLLVEINRIKKPKEASIRYPPASEKDIVALEKRLNFQFPPSYRAFLKLHNGWKNMRFGWCLFGVSGLGYIEPLKEFERDMKSIKKLYRRIGPKYDLDLKEKEKIDPDVIYIQHHPPLGMNYNGDYWVFDRNRPLKKGEYEIAWVIRGQFVEDRFHNLVEIVDEAIGRVQEELEDLGGSTDNFK